MTWALTIIALCGVLAVIVLLLVGLIGYQVDRLPRCRRCGYNLHGLAGAHSCPECGADVTERQAVRLGLRRKRKWALLAACAIAVITTLPGYFAGKDVAKNGVWQALPDWFVGKLAFSQNISIAADAAVELVRRDANGLLAPQVKGEVVASVVDAVEKGSKKLHWQLPLIVFDGMLDGTTTKAEAERFCLAYFTPRVELVRSGPNPTLRVEFAATSPIPLVIATPTGTVSYPQTFGWVAFIDSAMTCTELGVDLQYRYQVSPQKSNVFVFNCKASSVNSNLYLNLSRKVNLQFPMRAPGPRKATGSPLSMISIRSESTRVPISEISASSP